MPTQPAHARTIDDEGRLPAWATRDGTAGRILAIGLRLFARKGFHGASIRDLGGELGLKPANLYDHFRSKEHLLAELVHIGHDEHLRWLRAAVLAHVAPPEARLRALVRAHVLLHCEYPMLTIVANNELHALSPELAAPSLALRRKAEALLQDGVQRGIDARAFDPPDAFLATAAIGAMGIRVASWYRRGLAMTPEQVADGYAELALRMVRRRKR